MKALGATRPPFDDGWATELKWDGMRLQITIADGEVRLSSGSGRNVTSNFPELHAIADAFDPEHHGTVVLDGECVVFDEGRPSFQRLQNRIHVTNPTNHLVNTYPVFFVAFDLLVLQGQDLFAIPFQDRRRLLSDSLEDGPNWRVPPYSIGDPNELLDLAKERSLEGIVCKRLDSTYRPGERHPNWVKIKVRLRQEFVVGGWLPGGGGLTGSLGSLMVGVHDPDRDDGKLIWAGAVGSGLRDSLRTQLLAELETSDVCPFLAEPDIDKVPTWVTPTMVVEVEFGLWEEGAQLWHPTFCGVRVDRDPSDVQREPFVTTGDMG